MPALERFYLCACILVTSSEKVLDSSMLAQHCEASAKRLSRTHGRHMSDLYDKHLHKSLISNLAQHGLIVVDDNQISPTPTMLDMEAEARNLLGEQVRHAIINTALAVQANPAQKSST